MDPVNTSGGPKRGIKWAVDLTTVGQNQAHFMYADGPDHEEIEVWTGTPYQRYNHVHLLAKDINATRDWYMKHLGAKGDPKHIPNPGPPPKGMTFTDPPEKTFAAIWNTAVQVDGVIFNIFVQPDRASVLVGGPTDRRSLNRPMAM